MKISVALPVYNGDAYIAAALESVLCQTYANFELVISDNCSTDETSRILARYESRDRRIKVSRTDTLLPQADNVNRAVGLTSGEWIKLLCHDDLLEPSCLSEIADVSARARERGVILIGNGESWLFSNGYRYQPPAGSTEVEFADGREVVEGAFGVGPSRGLPSLTTATVLREAWDRHGGFDRQYAHFDVFLWTKMMLHGNYAYVSTPLTVNRIHSRQVAVEARKSLKSFEDHLLFWPNFVAEARREVPGLRVRAAILAYKPASVAATLVTIEILSHRLGSVRTILKQLPWKFRILALLLAPRALVRERRRTRPYRDFVPPDRIYPD